MRSQTLLFGQTLINKSTSRFFPPLRYSPSNSFHPFRAGKTVFLIQANGGAELPLWAETLSEKSSVTPTLNAGGTSESPSDVRLKKNN